MLIQASWASILQTKSDLNNKKTKYLQVILSFWSHVFTLSWWDGLDVHLFPSYKTSGVLRRLVKRGRSHSAHGSSTSVPSHTATDGRSDRVHMPVSGGLTEIQTDLSRTCKQRRPSGNVAMMNQCFTIKQSRPVLTAWTCPCEITAVCWRDDAFGKKGLYNCDTLLMWPPLEGIS